MNENGLLIPTKIIKSKRKSISLQIDTFGSFFVRAPINATDKTIFKFINEKAGWIIKKRSEILSNAIRPLQVVDGKRIEIIGCIYSIKLIDGRTKVKDDVIYVNDKSPKQNLIKLLKKMTKIYVTDKIEELKQQYKYNVKSISISSAHTNWGSCSYNNALHFSYKLALCPKPVVDYIIYHELSHTLVKNHSAKFWAEVAFVCPYYKQADTWLKKNRAIMNLI